MAQYLEKQQKQIGDVTYEVTALPGRTGSIVFLKLMKGIAPLLIGPAIMAAMRADSNALAGLDAGKISESIQNLSEADFAWICQTFAASTTLVEGDNRPPLGANNGAAYDLHFSRRYDAMIAWLEFSVEVNYGPFLQGVKAKMAKARAERDAAQARERASASSSPDTSTGASNAS